MSRLSDASISENTFYVSLNLEYLGDYGQGMVDVTDNAISVSGTNQEAMRGFKIFKLLCLVLAPFLAIVLPTGGCTFSPTFF